MKVLITLLFGVLTFTLAQSHGGSSWSNFRHGSGGFFSSLFGSGYKNSPWGSSNIFQQYNPPTTTTTTTTTAAPVVQPPRGGAAESRETCGCAPLSWSLDQKLDLIGSDNDRDGDDVVYYADLYYDASTRADKNLDGTITTRECTDRWACRYGDTEQRAAYVCTTLSNANANGTIARFNSPPFIAGVPMEQFRTRGGQRYLDFQNFNCVDNRYLTPAEKLDQVASDVLSMYDADGNGSVTMVEFVLRRLCHYADSSDFGRYVWNQLAQGASSISASTIQNQTLSRDNLSQIYENFRNSEASYYLYPAL